MKKNIYQKPEMNVVLLQHQSHLLAGSVTGVQSTGGTDWDDDDAFGFGGGSNGSGR